MKSHANVWFNRAALALGMVVVGGLTGLLVAWIGADDEMRAWRESGSPLWPIDVSQKPWEGMFYGILYATTMWSTMLGVRKLAYRYFPVRSWQALVVHIAANTAMMVAAFALLHVLDPWICLLLGNTPNHHTPAFGLVATVAFGAATVLTTLTYAADFYRAMQHAKQTALIAELRALRAQINPHFLFNTLNSIAALVPSQPKEAERVIEELSELFRYTLQASQHPSVSLEEDLRATERYIAIEQTRFRERLVVVRDIDRSLLDAQVPSLLVQPLIENAVKHGVARTEDACAIHLSVHRKGEQVELIVRDTGPGFASTDPAEVFGRGTGLANVRDRLHLHYGVLATLALLTDGVALRFPYRSVAEGRHDRMVAIPLRTAP